MQQTSLLALDISRLPTRWAMHAILSAHSKEERRGLCATLTEEQVTRIWQLLPQEKIERVAAELIDRLQQLRHGRGLNSHLDDWSAVMSLIYRSSTCVAVELWRGVRHDPVLRAFVLPHYAEETIESPVRFPDRSLSFPVTYEIASQIGNDPLIFAAIMRQLYYASDRPGKGDGRWKFLEEHVTDRLAGALFARWRSYEDEEGVARAVLSRSLAGTSLNPPLTKLALFEILQSRAWWQLYEVQEGANLVLITAPYEELTCSELMNIDFEQFPSEVAALWILSGSSLEEKWERCCRLEDPPLIRALQAFPVNRDSELFEHSWIVIRTRFCLSIQEGNYYQAREIWRCLEQPRDRLRLLEEVRFTHDQVVNMGRTLELSSTRRFQAMLRFTQPPIPCHSPAPSPFSDPEGWIASLCTPSPFSLSRHQLEGLGLSGLPRPFSERVKDRWQTGRFHSVNDLSLKFGGETLEMNRSFLAQASPYFNRLLSGEFQENKRSEIALEGVDYVVFLELVELLLTGKIPPNSDRLALAFTADRLDIQWIVHRCQTELVEALENSPCWETLFFPLVETRLHTHFPFDLLNEKINCIARSHREELKQQPQWISWVVQVPQFEAQFDASSSPVAPCTVAADTPDWEGIRERITPDIFLTCNGETLELNRWLLNLFTDRAPEITSRAIDSADLVFWKTVAHYSRTGELLPNSSPKALLDDLKELGHAELRFACERAAWKPKERPAPADLVEILNQAVEADTPLVRIACCEEIWQRAHEIIDDPAYLSLSWEAKERLLVYFEVRIS